MISTLHIKNIGIIDEMTIDLNEGLNILTGETGAGKTLIVDSLNIICGARFSKEMIRSSQHYSLVEACMYLPECEISEDGNVIVSREIYDTGKNLCKINGRLSTLSELKEFMKKHLDIHGQFDSQVIMDEVNHIDYLDSYIGKEMENIASEYKSYFEEYTDLNKKLKTNYGDDKEKQRMLSLLKYEFEEIDNAALKENEEEMLKEEYEIMRNGEKISEALNSAKDITESSIMDNFENVTRMISKISNLNSKYERIYNSLQDSYYLLEDTLSEISNEISSLDFDEERNISILKRLDLISNLKRKYGNNICEINKYKDGIKEKIEQIESLEEMNLKIKERLKIVEENMYSLAIKMNKIRQEKALKLEEKINSNFSELEMNFAKIKVQITINEKREFNNKGLDKVVFLICTNKGDEFKSLSKIASGGEISRIVLAIKSVLSEEDKVESCVFDEIDSGISGKAASSVGRKLKDIAKNHQVICVTHLAQVAACADYHFFISKKVESEKTVTNIKMLDKDEVVNELARISTGNVTDVALNYAQDLLKQSKIKIA